MSLAHHLHKQEEWIIYQESEIWRPAHSNAADLLFSYVLLFSTELLQPPTHQPHILWCSTSSSTFFYLFLFSFFLFFAQMKCLPWRCLPLKVAEAAKCSRGKFLYATEQKHLIAFWNKCVYFERRCLRRFVIAKPWVWRELCQLPQSWILSEFLYAFFHYEKCSWLRWLSLLLHQCLTVSPTSLAWSVTEISQIEEQRWQRRRGWGRTVFGCRVYVFSSVWAKNLTQVTFVSGNREDFQTVIRWCTEMDRAATADRIPVCFTSHTGV